MQCVPFFSLAFIIPVDTNNTNPPIELLWFNLTEYLIEQAGGEVNSAVGEVICGWWILLEKLL